MFLSGRLREQRQESGGRPVRDVPAYVEGRHVHDVDGAARPVGAHEVPERALVEPGLPRLAVRAEREDAPVLVAVLGARVLADARLEFGYEESPRGGDAPSVGAETLDDVPEDVGRSDDGEATPLVPASKPGARKSTAPAVFSRST